MLMCENCANHGIKKEADIQVKGGMYNYLCWQHFIEEAKVKVIKTLTENGKNHMANYKW